MSYGLGPWTTPVFFPNFLSNDPPQATTQSQSGVTFTASANGDSLSGGNINVSFGSCGSKRRGWSWSSDGNYFAYVCSPNGPDWSLTIVALQDLRRADCSLLKKGAIAATASGVFAGQSAPQWWTNANFGWLGSKAVVANGAYSGGSGSIRKLVCPEASGSRVWSELVPDRAGKIGWAFLSSPSGNAIAFAPQKLNVSAPQIDFVLISTATAKPGHFSKNGSTQSITATGPSPSITTNQHAANGVRVNQGDGTTIDVDDPDGTLRVGICKVQSFTFPPVVLDGPEDKTATLTAKIKNDGKATGCLQIIGIGNAGPFKVVTPSQYPLFIAPGGESPLSISFSPTQEKPYVENLPISAVSVDPTSDTIIHCSGSTRKSNAHYKISGAAFPEVVFGVSNTAVGTFCITYDGGGDKLKVNAISDSAPFSVASPAPDYSRLLGKGDQMAVNVEFRPKATGSFSGDMQVTCIPANGDKVMHLNATARMPKLAISATQPAPFTTFCYRKKKLTVTLSNSGEVPLEVAVSGSSPNFSVTPIAPIPANASSPLEIFVWSGSPGSFTVTLTITASFHLVVKDKVDQHTIMDQVLTTSCTVPVSGTVVPMPPDSLEPNDDIVEATKSDLPAPGFAEPAKLRYSSLTLHDCAGNDKDYFALSFTPGTQGEVCTTTVTSHTLGLKMFTYPTTLTISTKTIPALRDDGLPFSRTLHIYKSDTYNQQLVAETDGYYSVTCPSNTFADHKLYVVLSNPGFAAQGPIEYDISFEYQPSTTVLRGGAFNSVEFVKLKKYYDAIWKVDPPHDRYGKVVSVDKWCSGAPIVISDMKAFIKKHLAYIRRLDVVKSVEGKTSPLAKAILAAEYVSLAQTARANGLEKEAEELYKKGAAEYSKAGQKDNEVGALRGLLGLYQQRGLTDKAAGVAKVVTKARVIK